MSQAFNTHYYYCAGVTENTFTQSSQTISGVLDSEQATSGGSSYSADGSFRLYEGGKYTLYGFTQAVNGTFYPVGSATIDLAPLLPRPDDWEWSFPTDSGDDFDVTASEWINFLKRINQFRFYKGMSEYDFDTSHMWKGQGFTAFTMRQAAWAIYELNGGTSSTVRNVKTGDKIYGIYFDNIRNALNATS